MGFIVVIVFKKYKLKEQNTKELDTTMKLHINPLLGLCCVSHSVFKLLTINAYKNGKFNL